MTEWEDGDELGRALAALRVHDAAPGRVERIRSRCAALLAARRATGEASARRGAAWRPRLEPVAALSLGLLYLADVVRRALEVYR
jgi:hypothetical protein